MDYRHTSIHPGAGKILYLLVFSLIQNPCSTLKYELLQKRHSFFSSRACRGLPGINAGSEILLPEVQGVRLPQPVSWMVNRQ
jgi:hypothetical protein